MGHQHQVCVRGVPAPGLQLAVDIGDIESTSELARNGVVVENLRFPAHILQSFMKIPPHLCPFHRLLYRVRPGGYAADVLYCTVRGEKYIFLIISIPEGEKAHSRKGCGNYQCESCKELDFLHFCGKLGFAPQI